MSYRATVYRILVASPGDVTKERQAIPEVIGIWNDAHSEDHGVVLVPVRWETHSTPAMGDRPQAILNKQIVRSCNILIGAFWTRIVTHTGVAESGTAEEIEEFRNSGKPILLYFSSVPVMPGSVDPEQYKRLLEFKRVFRRHGLTEDYSSIRELREKRCAISPELSKTLMVSRILFPRVFARPSEKQKECRRSSAPSLLAQRWIGPQGEIWNLIV